MKSKKAVSTSGVRTPPLENACGKAFKRELGIALKAWERVL